MLATCQWVPRSRTRRRLVFVSFSRARARTAKAGPGATERAQGASRPRWTVPVSGAGPVSLELNLSPSREASRESLEEVSCRGELCRTSRTKLALFKVAGRRRRERRAQRQGYKGACLLGRPEGPEEASAFFGKFAMESRRGRQGGTLGVCFASLGLPLGRRGRAPSRLGTRPLASRSRIIPTRGRVDAPARRGGR